MIAELDRLGGADQLGYRSTANWLAVECRMDPRTARDYVRVAQRLEHWTKVRDALGDGRLSYSQCRAICRASDTEDEGRLLRLALRSTVVALEKHVRALRTAPSADPELAQAAREQRHVQWRWRERGTLRFWGELPAEDGARLIEAIETSASRIHAPTPGERRPGLGIRRADALAAIVRGGCPKTTLMLHADLDALVGEQGGRLHLRDGPSIPVDLARRLTCDAMVSIAGLNHGRTQRTVTPQQRRALEARDGRICWIPGCDQTHDLDAHHIDPWALGGRTDLHNLIQTCTHHHYRLHEGGWTLRRRDGYILLINPEGEIIAERKGPRRSRNRKGADRRQPRKARHTDRARARPTASVPRRE